MTFSDHLLLQSLVLSPVYALTNDVVLCYNLLLLISLAGSGLAMHALVRGVTGSTAAAFVAGLAWACWPYRTAHLLHLQLQSLYFLPLALLALHRVAAARQWRDVDCARRSGGAAGDLIGVLRRDDGGRAGRCLRSRLRGRAGSGAAGVTGLASLRPDVIGAVLIAPVAWPYWRTQQREGFGRNLYEAAAHSATLQSYTQVPPDNLLYGKTGLLPLRPPAPGERDRRHVEHQMFPGIVLLCLAAFGLWRGWRSDSRPVVLSGLALLVVGAVLSFGPDGAALGLRVGLALGLWFPGDSRAGAFCGHRDGRPVPSCGHGSRTGTCAAARRSRSSRSPCCSSTPTRRSTSCPRLHVRPPWASG